MTAIEFIDVTKSFEAPFKKKIRVLDSLSFRVKKGSITGFLGANGSGKTTSFKAMLGLFLIDSGKINILGEPITNTVKDNIGFMPERPYFPEYLSAYEFLQFAGSLHKKKLLSKDDVLETVGLKKSMYKPIRTFSKGMLQRLSLAQTILHQPDLIILDEPLSGLDPDGRDEMMKIIKALNASGVTIFLSSHLVDDIERLCDEIIVIDKGNCLYNGTVQFLLKSYASKTNIQTLENNKQVQYSFTDKSEVDKILTKALNNELEILSLINKTDLYAAVNQLKRPQ